MAKGLFGDHMSIIISTTSQDGIEFADQSGCGLSATSLDALPHFVPHAADALGRRLDQQLLSIFAHILAQEVEPVANVCNDAFLLREFQAPLLEEEHDDRFDLLLQDLPVGRSHNEIIRIAEKVYFV